jgi:hypothetical protein
MIVVNSVEDIVPKEDALMDPKNISRCAFIDAMVRFEWLLECLFNESRLDSLRNDKQPQARKLIQN